MSGTMKKQGLRRFMPYPEYKDSGVEWLGEIPAHWSAFAFRRLIRRIEQGWSPVAEDRLAGLDEWAVIKLSAVNKGRFLPDEHKALPANLAPDTRYEIHEGDFLLTRANTPDRVGDVCVARGIRPKLMLCDLVYRLQLLDDRLSPTFLAYWLVSSVGRYQIEVDARGSSQSMVKVSQGHIRAWMLPLPPEEEQRTIVAFLDRETAKIDELVAKKERLIELLQEKRAALITRAVTKGLDPSVAMKDSGTEWLGNIPAHWDVKRLWHVTPSDRRIMYGIVLPGPNVGDGIPIVKGGDVAANRLRLELLNRTSRDIESGYVRSRLRGGDLVFAIRGSIGEVAMVPDELEGANLTQDAARVAYTPNVHGPWLLYALKSAAVFAQLDAGALGATIRGINIRDLKRASLPVPPRQEQEAIATILNRETARTDGLIAKVREAIERLKELRTTLISAAVTGKIDVRASGTGA